MKLRALAIFGGILLAAALSAQTLTDVINEFNTGVEKLNNQEHDVSVEYFNRVISMAATLGDEGNDMKQKAEDQIPSAYYRQATVYMKRKQYDNAIPYLEKTVEFATLYNNNEETKVKAAKYLPQLYVREGNQSWKNKNFDQANAYFDKALALDPTLYQAHQGKGMVFLDQDETDAMLSEFALAKEAAKAEGDSKTIEQVNDVIDAYYNKFITEELEMVDPEENDYTYVVEACDNALAANPENPRALYHLALVANKKSESDKAVEYAKQALQYEKEAIWISAINFELGTAYKDADESDNACEALQKVVDEPFLTRAEKMISNIGCN